MPKRIQRMRTKGWRKPAGAVNVTRPSKWGNPFVVGKSLYLGAPIVSNEQAVAAYQQMLTTPREFEANEAHRLAQIDCIKRELRGKDLMCYCPLDQPCHADVLLRIANE